MLDILFFATSALTIYHAEFFSAVSLEWAIFISLGGLLGAKGLNYT